MTALSSLLSDELLVRCHVRAETVDHPAWSIADDVAELQEAGFFRQSLPSTVGGADLTLASVCHEVRRLAYYAPATADAAVMHLAWMGVAAERQRAGDDMLHWLQVEGARGGLLATAYAEPGNDAPLLTAATRAERVDGGYRFTGHKRAAILPPTWSFLGIHGVGRLNGVPRLFFAFLPRHTEGYAIRGADLAGGVTGGSGDVLLDAAFVADRHVVHTALPDDRDADPLLEAFATWSLLLQANVTGARAQRALDLAVDAMHRAPSGRAASTMAHDPLVQADVARMALPVELMEPLLDLLARPRSAGSRHGTRWLLRLLAAHAQVLDGALSAIDHAAALMATTPMARRAGLDALREGVRQAPLQSVAPAAARLAVGRNRLGLPLVDLAARP